MTTISISRSKHRSSQSLATLPLENIAQQRLPSSNESNVSGISSVSHFVPKRHSGEFPIKTSSNVKTTRRRARSTFGGGEDDVNGLDFAAGAASQSEENRPVLFFTSKGLNENGFGRVSMQFTTLRKPTAASPPAKEKQGLMGKSGAGSVAKLGRSLSERPATKIASRATPLPEILPRDCPLLMHGTQCTLPSGESDNDTEVVCEPPPVKQEEEIEPCTVEKRPSESPTAAIIDGRCASPEMNPRTTSLQESHDDECFVEEHQVDAIVEERSCASQEIDPRTSLQERDDRLVEEQRVAVILHHRRASQAMDSSTCLHERDDDCLVEEQQDATPSCQSDSIVGEQGMQQPELFRQDDVEKEPKATMPEEDPSNVHVEASEMARMEELNCSAFDAGQKSNADEIAVSVEQPSHTLPEQSSGSLAHQEPSNVVEKLEHVIIAWEASTPDLQEEYELGPNQVVNESTGNPGSRVCLNPTPSLLQSSETSRVLGLFLEDGSQANGSQNMHNRTASLEQQETESCTKLQENEGVLRLPSAAAQDSFDLSPVLGSGSSGTVMHLCKISMRMMSTDESSSSSRWTSDSAVFSKLPDAGHQELNLSGEHGAANEKRFSTSQHVQFVVPVVTAEKVTEEQLTEAAFLSNLGYHGKESTIRCARSQDIQQSAAAALTNRTNAFRSKSTGRLTAKLAVREDVGLANAYSDSEQDAMATVSAADRILPLEHPRVCSSRFSKIDLNSCHNIHDRVLPKQFLDVVLTGSARWQYGPLKKNLTDDNNNNHPVITANALSSPTEKAAAAMCHPNLETHLTRKGNGERTMTSGLEEQFIKDVVQDVFLQEENSKGALGKQDADTVVTALKSEKIDTSQTTTLMKNSAFPRAVAAESAGLASERPESESLHQMNADHVKGCFNPVISTANGVQLQNGVESKTKLMNAECQQQNRADFMNSRFGMVQAMSSSNQMSKLAPLMAKPTLEGRVMLSTMDKSQSIRQMLLVSPRQSLEDYHLGPSSIYILGDPSFSSSHQDRLWEEQAEAYSSGGRGTPGREENSTTAAFVAPRPASAVSGDVLLPSSASLSARKGVSDATVVPTATDTWTEKGKSHSGKKPKAKKISKPRTPLQSLLAEEIKGKGSHDRNSVNWSSSSGTNPCMKQLMLRIRENLAPKSSSPKSQHSRSPRSSVWSSCICFSPLP